MAAQHKFIPPTCFSAKVGENAVDWLERYELTARYNHWGNQEMRNNFVMYLEGTARKWYLFSNLPGDWEDQEAVPAAPAVPFVAGLRTVFLQEFKQDNFALIQETKLRQRVQGEEEDAASYYYDILHMCHAVNPNMPQTQQLDFLYSGLRKSLVKKIYPLKPKTCKEFLELLKLHTEASLLLDRRSWTEKNRLGTSQPDLQTIAVVRKEQSTWKENLDLGSILAGLQDSLNELKNASKQKKVTFDATHSNQRTSDGRPVCNYCSRTGHIARNCFRNPKSQLFRGGQQSVLYRPSNGSPPRNGVSVNYIDEEAFQEENSP